jgi:hypothetical protein
MMSDSHGLPYAGALDAVKRIESALGERDVARQALDSGIDAAHVEAERLLSEAHNTGVRAAETQRVALLARANADAEVIRSDGVAEAQQIARQVSTQRDLVAAEFAALLLVEEP